MLFAFYLASIVISIIRYTIIYEFPEIHDQLATLFIIMTCIDLTLNLIAQIIILSVFYINFSFFRDEHIKSAGYPTMPIKLKLLTIWIIFLVL